jgi:DNA-binding NarL/FixJ family response regulator
VIVLYLTSDLLFSSRVASAAAQHGIAVVVLSDLAALQVHLQQDSPRAVILDLEHRAADPASVMEHVLASTSRPTVVAYGPHVKQSLLDAAQSARVDLVLSRGQFNSQVANLFQQLKQSQSSDP